MKAATEKIKEKVLSSISIPSKIRDGTERGGISSILYRADKLRSENKNVIYCQVGTHHGSTHNPKRITFYHQYLSLLQYPAISDSKLKSLYPSDVLERAAQSLKDIPGGLGSYSHSQGLPFVRKNVAKYISERDDIPCSPDDLFLYNGAASAIQAAYKLLIRSPGDGVLVPTPRYHPGYSFLSATLGLVGGARVHYPLSVDNWQLSFSELETCLHRAQRIPIQTRALAVVNPLNPLGETMSVDFMKEIVKFCKKHKLVLLADEVYQNVYIKKDNPFTSFKKVVKSMGPEYENFELISFHSISKGFAGECGIRGGYLELTNIDEEAKKQVYKLASVDLCPNSSGQIMLDVMVNPPKQGEPSHPLFEKERNEIYESMIKRTAKILPSLQSLEGVTVKSSPESLYAYAEFKLPTSARIAAEKKGFAYTDEYYAASLLEQTGICIVPSSRLLGAGPEAPFTFRTFIYPPEDQVEYVSEKLSNFHKEFLQQHSQ